MKKLTLQEITKRAKHKAKTNNGKFLGITDIGGKYFCEFRCSKDHTWKIPHNQLSNPSWCNTCGRINTIKSHKHTLEDMCRLAEKHKMVFLSKEYLGAFKDHTWKCESFGHVWEAKPAFISGGTGCPTCFRIRQSNRQKKPWQDIIAECEKNDIEVLSKAEVYHGRKSVLEFKCLKDKKHVWKTRVGTILSNHGCPFCNHRSFAYTIDDIDSIVTKRGWKCLTRNYVNQDTPLLMECRNGHHWKTKGVYIVNTLCGCPECSRRRGEKRCAALFASLFNVEFRKVKPVWLNNLELDGYNEGLRLGFEYNGSQHYECHKFFHQNRSLEETQVADSEKRKLCDVLGIKLAIIPAADTTKEIYDTIRKELVRLDISVPDLNQEKLDEVENLA